VGGYDNPKLGGESLRMWKKYFPFGTIYSIDIFDKSFHEENRIKIFKGSQVDEEFLQGLVNVTGPLDIIIDDGSHINEHAIKSFKILFPSLKIGGLYVIEDTQTSYWPDYGGNSDDLHHADTMLNFFKQLTDCLNHKEFIRPGYIPDYFDRHIVDMHFYHNMVFIHKDKNVEESNFLKNNILPS
jgi:demethylmacrocin O-methyltransferase